MDSILFILWSPTWWLILESKMVADLAVLQKSDCPPITLASSV